MKEGFFIYIFFFVMYNPYIKYNYKYILPYYLKKKKNRVHGSLIAVKKFPFSFSYFEVNGSKGDGNFLEKNFRKTKLSVFFISKFNMRESKWLLPISYYTYYKKNRYLLDIKYIFNKNKFLLMNNNNNYISIFFFKNLQLIRKNNLNDFLLNNVFLWKKKINMSILNTINLKNLVKRHNFNIIKNISKRSIQFILMKKNYNYINAFANKILSKQELIEKARELEDLEKKERLTFFEKMQFKKGQKPYSMIKFRQRDYKVLVAVLDVHENENFKKIFISKMGPLFLKKISNLKKKSSLMKSLFLNKKRILLKKKNFKVKIKAQDFTKIKKIKKQLLTNIVLKQNKLKIIKYKYFLKTIEKIRLIKLLKGIKTDRSGSYYNLDFFYINFLKYKMLSLNLKSDKKEIKKKVIKNKAIKNKFIKNKLDNKEIKNKAIKNKVRTLYNYINFCKSEKFLKYLFLCYKNIENGFYTNEDIFKIFNNILLKINIIRKFQNNNMIFSAKNHIIILKKTNFSIFLEKKYTKNLKYNFLKFSYYNLYFKSFYKIKNFIKWFYKNINLKYFEYFKNFINTFELLKTRDILNSISIKKWFNYTKHSVFLRTRLLGKTRIRRFHVFIRFWDRNKRPKWRPRKKRRHLKWLRRLTCYNERIGVKFARKRHKHLLLNYNQIFDFYKYWINSFNLFLISGNIPYIDNYNFNIKYYIEHNHYHKNLFLKKVKNMQNFMYWKNKRKWRNKMNYQNNINFINKRNRQNQIKRRKLINIKSKMNWKEQIIWRKKRRIERKKKWKNFMYWKNKRKWRNKMNLKNNINFINKNKEKTIKNKNQQNLKIKNSKIKVNNKIIQEVGKKKKINKNI